MRKAQSLRTALRSVGDLNENAFHLYEEFRPAIAEGVSGWGAKGKLDLARIRSLASEK